MRSFPSVLNSALAAMLLLACGPTTVEEVKKEPAEKKAPEPTPEPKPEPKAEPEQEPEPAGPKLPKTAASFEAAVETASDVYEGSRRTFFCGCKYNAAHKVARGTCGYRTRADEILARKVAWEKVVPVRAFGAHRECWKSPICKDDAGAPFSGVRCCQEKDPIFKAMEADLHNIVPVIAELQEDRSNYPYGDVPKEERLYGSCDVEVDRRQRVVEPPENVRGDIARTYLYMRQVYGDELPLSPADLQMYQQWHEEDPPDAWEVDRNRRIAGIQGRANNALPIKLTEEEAEAAERPRKTPGGAKKAPPDVPPPAGEAPPAKAPPPEKEAPPAKTPAPAKEAPPAKAPPAKAPPAKAAG